MGHYVVLDIDGFIDYNVFQRISSRGEFSMEKDFLERQEVRLVKRLTYYRRLNTDTRLAEYLQFKVEKIIPRIEKALALIQTGNYGQCQSCPEKITIERLQIIPAAIHCRPCQAKQEA